MPPKKRAAKAKAITAEIHSVPSVPDGPALTGYLATLSTELLVALLVGLPAEGFAHLTATCHALKDFVGRNEVMIYSKRYNMRKDRVGGSHVIYSPVYKRGGSIAEATSSEPLPLSLVYDWKMQYFQDLFYHRETEYVRCSVCLEAIHNSLVEHFVAWKVKLCPSCFSMNVLVKSNAVIYGLTLGDISKLKTITLNTFNDYAQEVVTCNLYYCNTLHQIAIQKNPYFSGPAAKAKGNGNGAAKSTSENYRATMNTIQVAALLQGGTTAFIDFSNARIKSNGALVDVGFFAQEFLQLLSPENRQDNSKKAKKPSRLETVLASQRTLAQVLQGYGDLLETHGDAFPENQFIAAKDPGPFIPTDESIQAYSKLSQIAAENDYSIQRLEVIRTDLKSLRIFQSYVREPDDDNLEAVNDLFLDFHLRKKKTAGTLASITLPDMVNVDIDSYQTICVPRLGAEAENRRERLILIQQISLIIGKSQESSNRYSSPSNSSSVNKGLSTQEVERMCSDSPITVDSFFGTAYYVTGKNLALIPAIYEATTARRNNSLDKLISSHNERAKQSAIRLSSLMCIANNLSDRTRISFDDLVKDYSERIKFDSSLVTAFAQNAIDMRLERKICSYADNSICRDGCWIKNRLRKEIKSLEI